MTHVIINPGTGPVAGAKKKQARKNIRQFISDVAGEEILHVAEGGGEDGRWDFKLVRRAGKRLLKCWVSMPGVESAVLGEPWVSPRLYVDGSSWLWGFAISRAREALGFECRECEEPTPKPHKTRLCKRCRDE